MKAEFVVLDCECRAIKFDGDGEMASQLLIVHYCADESDYFNLLPSAFVRDTDYAPVKRPMAAGEIKTFITKLKNSIKYAEGALNTRAALKYLIENE
jgi:hypothetical protein